MQTAVFIIAKIWKQPRCPTVGGKINKVWDIQTREYYSILKQMIYHKRHGENLNVWNEPIWNGHIVWFQQWHSEKGKVIETGERVVARAGRTVTNK